METAARSGVPAFRIEPPFDLTGVPDLPAVFLVRLGDARPYLSRTSALRRRLNRLLSEASSGARRLNLGHLASSVECYPVKGRLPASLLYYRLARALFPDEYRQMVKLRFPAYVKLLLSNGYPRTEVSVRFSGSGALHYGPFPSRAAAEDFEGELLDQFQVRRCVEDLVPSPDHPGCIYGEMMRCLRPCQDAVSAEEYRGESRRMAQFLSTSGISLIEPVRVARDRFSAELDFEQAQRQHERLQRIEQALKLGGGLAMDASRLSGVAVYPSFEPRMVDLFFMLDGAWLEPVPFSVAADASGSMAPMDRRLRELFASLAPPALPARERAEHLALLARWFHSSFRDAAWIGFENPQPPYRKLVRGISKAASGVGVEPG
jgi:excinuclease UvrABC nuclease subunit